MLHKCLLDICYVSGPVDQQGMRQHGPWNFSLVGEGDFKETLLAEYRNAVAQVAADDPIVIGGKSMGGRVASMIVDELHSADTVAGLVCLGYPFHPIAKPEQLRTAHLESLAAPALIAQGTRDAFGSRDEVAQYTLSPAIELLWLEDGDHDLRPRKGVSGFTYAHHLETMADAVARFVRRS